MVSTDSQSAASSSDPRRDLSELQFRVVPFAPEHLPAVSAFSKRYWSRAREESYLRWRYLDSLPFSQLHLALTEAECLGMLAALRKTYLIGGTPTSCLEIFDWHSLPGLRGSGVGIRVMRAMMREGDRLIGVGGTPDAVKALPAMGWQQLGVAMNYELPLSGRAVETGFHGRMGFTFPGERLVLDGIARWYRPRRRTFTGRALPVSSVGDEVGAFYSTETGYGLVQIPDPALLRWMTAGFPGNGAFQYWYFAVGDRLCGWALTRLYETSAGREAAIVDIFTPRPDVELYAWMVSEAATALAGAAPRLIRARASCPVLQAALRANRFRPGTGTPVFTWPKNLPADIELHVTMNHTDSPFRPYPEPGWLTGIEGA